MKKITLSFIAILACSSAFANEEATQLHIQQLMEQNNPKQAYELAKLNYANSNELNELFVLAQLAKSNGRLMEAKSYYERMLTIRPDLSRIKLELADVNVSLGKAQQAKQLLLDVNSESLPPNVKLNVERYLQAINAGQYPKNSSFSITVQSVYDTNVNSGPNADTVTIFGLPFQLSDDAKENADLGYAVNANYIHNYRISDDTSLNSNISLGYTGWGDFNQLNNLVGSIKTGVSQRLSDKQTFYFPIEYSKSYVDGEDYYDSYGISPTLTHRFNRQAFVSATAVGSKRQYNQSDKEADIYSGSLRFGYQMSPQTSVSLQTAYGTEDYNINADDNAFYSANVTLSHSLSPKLSGYAGASYSNVSYDNVAVSQQVAREDDNYGARIGLNYLVSPNTSVVLDVSYNDNQSNIDLNDYDRTRISMGVNATF